MKSGQPVTFFFMVSIRSPSRGLRDVVTPYVYTVAFKQLWFKPHCCLIAITSPTYFSLQKLPSNTCEVISKYFQHEALVYMALMFFDALAEGRPKDVMAHDSDIINLMNTNENASSMAAGILTKLAIDKVCSI